MAASYDERVDELYQAPHGSFVAERKRLAGELKAAGDKDGAARLAKLPRPSISAWAVNQLWWHARDAFDAMLETAERLRAGDLAAAAAHRETLAKLRAQTAAILVGAGHGATESTLRRVMTTLSAIAANGGFAPDAPGTLAEDRDPPGFETMGLAPLAPKPAPPTPEPKHAGAKVIETDVFDTARKAAEEERARAADEARIAAAEEARRRAEDAAERRRADQEAARRKAERHRIEAALRTAAGEVERYRRDVERLRGAVEEAEAKVKQSRAIVEDLEQKLAELAE